MKWAITYTHLLSRKAGIKGREYYCPKCLSSRQDCYCYPTHFTLEDMAKPNWKP